MSKPREIVWSQPWVMRQGRTTRTYKTWDDIPKRYWKLKSRTQWRREGFRVTKDATPVEFRSLPGYGRFAVYGKKQVVPIKRRKRIIVSEQEAGPIDVDAFYNELQNID